MQDEAGTRRHKGIFLLPNLLTTAGLFAGFFSIVAAIDGDFSAAAWATVIAIILDGLDGRVARMTSTESDFGKEYDSLADMVSFGLAPAIVTYQWGVERLAEYGALWGRAGWLATFLYAVAAAFRLARFNTTTATLDKSYFQGLPSPPAAAAVVSLVWINTTFESVLFGLTTGIVFTAIVGLLMVSHFRYRSFKTIGPRRRVRFESLVWIPVMISVIAFFKLYAIFAVAVIYAASGPVSWLLRMRAGQDSAAATVDTADDAAAARTDADDEGSA